MSDSWFDDAPPTPAPPREVLTISQLNAQARTLLERGLGSVWIEGEISNLARPGSGHWYFSLKDAGAQVRCAMFRTRAMLVQFAVRDGARVLARGRVSLYEARGEFQVVVEHLEEAGEGALRRRFEELKRKLLAEGLFEAARKRRPPTLPRRIGVVTSPTGAALRDVLHILHRRFPAVPVLVYPVAVQGDVAPREIVQALQLAGQRAECDVLIVARGGGSLEDLMAFNEESVARAIAASPIPVISGVGHETDFTIADFVADERAPTPSGAAERAVPDAAEFLRALSALERNLAGAVRRRLQSFAQALRAHERGLARSHPGARLRQHAQRLDELEQRLQRAVGRKLERTRLRLANADVLLARSSPARRLATLRLRLGGAERQLPLCMQRRLRQARDRFERATRTLHAVGPLATLERGYAIVLDAGRHVVTDATAVSRGMQIEARLARGSIRATVTDTLPLPGDGKT
ncbi:MAG TPA: exodeoxyribonuclease VII large subunit [Steroidobacteraceae bacterium]|nr:exodeoxyribonuclease VII large subunit [Steroidobacteraceae bacterium]